MLENLKVGANVRGLTASGAATVESVQWIGQQVVKVVFCDGKERQIWLRPMISFGRAEPVAVAKPGRPVVVVMAVEELERLNRIEQKAKDAQLE